MARSSWQVVRGGRTYYVDVTDHEVICGSHAGSEASDEAGACSHGEFLAGRFQDVVRGDHGDDTVVQVLAAVKARTSGDVI